MANPSKPSPAQVARDAADGKGGPERVRPLATLRAADRRKGLTPSTSAASILGSDPYVAAMTSLETIRAADAAVPADSGLWRAELGQTIRLAVPMALTQLGQIVMMTTDLVLIGRLGDAPLAAAALAHTVLFAAFTLGMGLVSAVAPLGRAGLWRPPAAHGAPRAARRPVGGGDPGRADDAGAVLGRGHPARARPAAPGGRAGRPLSHRHGLGHHPRLGVHRPAQLHGRGQPARAGAVDHAGRHPDQRRSSPTR